MFTALNFQGAHCTDFPAKIQQIQSQIIFGQLPRPVLRLSLIHISTAMTSHQNRLLDIFFITDIREPLEIRFAG